MGTGSRLCFVQILRNSEPVCCINKKMYKSAELAALGIAFTSRFPFPGGFSVRAGQAACELEFQTGFVGNWFISSVCGCVSLSLPVPSFSGWGPGDVCQKRVFSWCASFSGKL